MRIRVVKTRQELPFSSVERGKQIVYALYELTVDEPYPLFCSESDRDLYLLCLQSAVITAEDPLTENTVFAVSFHPDDGFDGRNYEILPEEDPPPVVEIEADYEA